MKTTSTFSRLLVAMLLIFFAWSCAPSTSNGAENEVNEVLQEEAKAALKANREFLQKMAEPSQTFKQKADKPFEITGKHGTVIQADPKDLVFEDGSPVTGEIEVELKELTTISEMAFNAAPTTSGGQLLETGGSYFINMTADGKQLKIKEGSAIEVNFPKSKQPGMELFAGKRDENGVMDWQPMNQKLEEMPKPEQPAQPKEVASSHGGVKDTLNSGLDDIMAFLQSGKPSNPEKQMTAKEREEYNEAMRKYRRMEALQNKVYETESLYSFGWFNCDRFFDDPAQKVEVMVDAVDTSGNTPLGYLFVDGVKGMMSGSTNFRTPTRVVFANLPIGRTVHVLLCSLREKGVYMAYSSFRIEDQSVRKLELKVSSDEAIKEKFIEMNQVAKNS